MKYTRRLSTIMIGALLVLMALSLVPLIPTVSAQSESLNYSTDTIVSGVIEQDRYDYMNADDNPLHEDIANAVFQGPGVLGSPTVGYMKDIDLYLTNYGTLLGMHYPYGEEKNLPIIEETPAPGVQYAPLEGWAISYNLTVYPTTQSDSGYLIVTYSGYGEDGRIHPNVYLQDSDDDWEITVTPTSWVDNPRLLVRFYNITLINHGSPYTPVFELDVIVIFNKATKFVEIFQNLKLVDIDLAGCISVVFHMSLARMAIFDANPYCDRAFYGWKNVTFSDPESFFIVLSWTNETLDKWVRHTELGYNYYAAYMVSYPIPDNWAIASTWYGFGEYNESSEKFISVISEPAAAKVWSAPTLASMGLNRAAFLYMGDIDNDDNGDGDQALVRVEWYKSIMQKTPEYLIGLETGWKMVMYGVYDVGENYDGGEGGWFAEGYVGLSNDTAYAWISQDKYGNPIYIAPLDINFVKPENMSEIMPTDTWTHTGSLGFLNLEEPDSSILHEDQLAKNVTYLDIDQDGNKGLAEDEDYEVDIDRVGVNVTSADEFNITYTWYPTEELWWQLSWKFNPPVFCKKLYSTCCKYANIVGWKQGSDDFVTNDFVVLPAPGATPDASGAAWLNGLYTAWLVTFDVEAYNMTATVGYTNPAMKMLPYLMLRLESIPNSTEIYRENTWKSGRVGHYMTEDLRALPQMEWDQVPDDLQGKAYHTDTLWRQVHYFAITVAGIHPNLLTFYANDFSPIVRPIGGDLGPGYLAVLPTGPVVPIAKYVGGDVGAGVIALARDHFNNVYFIVYGLDAQDTYWTAWFATFALPAIISEPKYEEIRCSQAIMIEIDYSDIGHSWGNGTGIPIAHPNYPFNGEPVFKILYNAIEHGNLDGDWSCNCYRY